jgi:hypothetical protein
MDDRTVAAGCRAVVKMGIRSPSTKFQLARLIRSKDGTFRAGRFFSERLVARSDSLVG